MGAPDVAPTADGLAHAAALGANLHADRVYASPLSRAELAATALFPGVVVTLDDVAALAATGRAVVVSHNGWIRTAQYPAGEAGLADFHVHPVPQLVPTPLALPVHARSG